MALDPNWVDQFFESAFVVDDQGVGRLVVSETTTSPDGAVKIRGKYASQVTPNNTVVKIPLPWTADAGTLWAIDVIVTAKGTGVRRRIKLSAIVYGVGAVATLDGDVDVDPKGTGASTATISVDGSTSVMTLELHPDNIVITWGFEVRGQQL